MTDKFDHRAAAEAALSDAIEWGQQAGEPTPEAGELACLAYAAVHALLAIHDALTAADRYAANEAKQREEADMDEVLALGRKAGKRWSRTLDLLKQAEAEEREEAAEPDPLDEDDHRDRVDANGQRWGRMDGGCWHHEGKYPHAFGRCSLTLQQLQGSYGLLAFAPEAAQEAAGGDLSASEGESGSVEGEGADDASETLLCPECGHDLEDHGLADCCECPRSPAGVAYSLIEQAVNAKRARLTTQLRLTTSSVQDSGDLAELDALADEWEAR